MPRLARDALRSYEPAEDLLWRHSCRTNSIYCPRMSVIGRYWTFANEHAGWKVYWEAASLIACPKRTQTFKKCGIRRPRARRTCIIVKHASRCRGRRSITRFVSHRSVSTNLCRPRQRWYDSRIKPRNGILAVQINFLLFISSSLLIGTALSTFPAAVSCPMNDIHRVIRHDARSVPLDSNLSLSRLLFYQRARN